MAYIDRTARQDFCGGAPAAPVEVRAPYTFVEFENRVAVRYPSAEALPRHDQWDPKRLSGRIDLTLTAETPVFVGGTAEDKKTQPFARNGRGQYIIPGSTLRGLVRRNMQILGLGLMRPGQEMQDVRLAYRKLAAGKDTYAAELNVQYKAALKIQTVKGCTIPRGVKAGMLYCMPGNGGDIYEIRPLQRDVYYIKSRIDKKDRRDRGVSNPVLKNWKKQLGRVYSEDELFALEQTVYYSADGDRVTQLSPKPSAGLKQGCLVRPGRMHDQNTYYLFPAEEMFADPDALTPDEKRQYGFRYPSQEDILSLKEDWERRKNQLPGTHPNVKYDAKFWALPGAGEHKPVFYLENDGKISIGRSPFLRMTYNQPLSAGLPARHRALLAQDEQARVLDYPSAVMGYATNRGSYRSRVQVGDLIAPPQTKPLPAVTLPLGEPKPSFYAGYTKNGTHYNEDFALNGYKMYWFKPVQAPPTGIKENMGSAIVPLPAGTAFTGSITYHNLTEDELGLLLWCLKLEDGCYHAVGKAKPYGYGRMKLTTLTLTEWNAKAYGSLTAADVSAPASRVTQLIEAYKSYLPQLTATVNNKGKQKLGSAVDKLASVRQFLYLSRTVRSDPEQVQYMELPQFAKASGVLKPLKDYLTEADTAAAAPTLQDDDLWARLEAVSNRNRRGRR